MKLKEKIEARNLRKEGWSIKQIGKSLGVAKASVSIWVRDIQLSPEQLQKLSERGQNREIIEKRRKTRLERENFRRQLIINKAESGISTVSERELFLFGIALYWAEGSKTKRGVVELSNADPELIRVGIRFFREICKVPPEKFRCHVYLHPHLNSKKAEQYWSSVSGIPKKQFYKTSMQQSRASKNKHDSLPYGTCAISICDTELFLKIKGWTKGVVKQLECGYMQQLSLSAS